MSPLDAAAWQSGAAATFSGTKKHREINSLHSNINMHHSGPTILTNAGAAVEFYTVAAPGPRRG
jgi:hypothetical protein